MEVIALRSLIQTKLSDGRLPQNSIPRVWGGAGNEEIITKAQFVMEGVSTTARGPGIQFHVLCFQLWDAERQAPGRT